MSAFSHLFRRTATAGLLAATMACGNDPLAAKEEFAAPGEPARITLEEVQWTGGTAHHNRTVVDSATASYVETLCEESPGGVTCAATTRSRSGTFPGSWRNELFARVQANDFRALLASYPAPAGVTPPDHSSGTLIVTTNGRTRRITWDGAATLPPALAAVICRMGVVRGWLILCGE